MKSRLLAIAVIGIFLVAAPRASFAAEKDADGIQGTWLVEVAERNGEKVPEEEVKTMRVTFKGDKVVVRNKDRAEPEQTFTLDPAKMPKTIDVTPGAEGIYELKGDSLKILFMKDKSGRPTEFSSPIKKGQSLLVLKREKP